SVEVIGEQVFQECASLKSVTIENGVKTIGKKAFKKSGLTNITIPKSVETIENETFVECESLTSVTIANGVKNIGEKSFEGTALTELRIPASVEVIGVKTFQNCKSLANVTIDSGVKEIGEKAFNGTAIKEIKIPASVTSIGKDILPKNTVWDVEVGTYAYNYALENKLQIKPSDAVIKDKAARLLSDKGIAAAPSDKWEKGTFTKDDVTRKWDFSAYLSGDGKYTIKFKYTGGANKLTLSDAIFTADGKPIAYFQESRSAGSNPKEIVYEIEVPKGTKKLLLYANAKAGGGDNSNGKIEVVK
ncbi:MAG: leucine-rich repeat domain-containing protein, partial [Spirochaetales bacterium]|nr:leucine-rich repeat domain-containing protein [Spirochaetales bacterium]